MSLTKKVLSFGALKPTSLSHARFGEIFFIRAEQRPDGNT